jgi:hypothetical protein
MVEQVTLLISHKGVDLHAATARRVLRDLPGGGERLLALARAEFHTFWPGTEVADDVTGPGAERLTVDRLLGTGRYFNPNKHHYAHFRLAGSGGPWAGRGEGCRGAALPDGWPGTPVASDCGVADPGLLERLLGARSPPAGAGCVDVCAFPLDAPGPLLSGVLWRLMIGSGAADVLAVAEALAVTRGARHGLLVNPHLEGWLIGTLAAIGRGGRN